ncbi:MAG: aminopeptidase P family protein [Candidatus Scalindua sp. AMX11]|nr:MAG: aminopeptidase P family protein [Candidatus Scalindua sp.]NOG85085.1 aminopeptidase P family protein [Planctomycetota bacterium]RZV93132.1 MAG: aminopeptidase P family protein [Candidatus Scalindua sp. SCAELEC01]TDE66758.1 MAG: aminopeptidase P family protein [Candidatus Scalindua sp. AMX11]GJQ58070.1 MAG: peptidase M24 family protein [Candidatus Scalindua sp.]
MHDQEAILLIADSEKDSNMFYATGFLAPDPFVYLQKIDRKIIVVNDLEIDRAKSQSKTGEVLSLSQYEKIAVEQNKKPPKLIDTVIILLNEVNIKKLIVPENFSIKYADMLRKHGFQLEVKQEPFFSAREVKNEQEIGYMTKTLRMAEKALSKAINTIAKSSIKNGFLYSKSGKAITSESIKKMINVELVKNGCIAKHTIVSCHEQSCEPHNGGSGPLRANESIIFDIFPKDEETGYYADISRTIVKGKASLSLKSMYNAVLSAQNLVFRFARSGASGSNIHGNVINHFKSLGYTTGKTKGKMRGFFHGTGHGVGLDIHETPRISRSKYTLRTGNVVTVEPGLYYPGIGGVRLEDTIRITDDGCVNLTKYPKVLEV